MPYPDDTEDVALLTLPERQDRTNARAEKQQEKIDGRRRELTGAMEWTGEDEEK